MNAALTDDFRDLISLSFKSDEDEWWVRNLSDSYDFLENDKLKWIIDGDTNHSLIFYKSPGSDWQRLNKWNESLPAINSILQKKEGKIILPSEDAENFSKLIMELYEEPRGYVCTPSFINEQETVLDSFIINKEFGVVELKKSCFTPHYSSENNKWNLEFNVLNVQGSIKKWIVSGIVTPFSIDKIDREVIYPDDTFYYPDEF